MQNSSYEVQGVYQLRQDEWLAKMEEKTKENTMTKEEALRKSKKEWVFLRDYPEWNNDKEIVLAAVKQWVWALQCTSNELKNDKDVVFAAVQKNGTSLKFASGELKNNKDIVMAAVKESGYALAYASDELRRNRKIVLTAVASDIDACDYSLLEGYQNFDDIVEKEGEGFLFPCWNSEDWEIRLRVANHPNFLPTLEQLEIGLEDEGDEVQEIYRLRKDEWLAKIEENKLRNTV